MYGALSLSATNFDEETLQNLTRCLCRDLCDKVGVTSCLATQPAASGDKGNLPVLRQIVITAFLMRPMIRDFLPTHYSKTNKRL